MRKMNSGMLASMSGLLASSGAFGMMERSGKKHKAPKEFTQSDQERIDKAQAKRERKAAKRLQNTRRI